MDRLVKEKIYKTLTIPLHVTLRYRTTLKKKTYKEKESW